MTERHERVLAVVPARGGSKGLRGKNVRPLAGIPLIAHTVLFARMCPALDRVVVSTDSLEIADIARQFGGDVPFIRPPELARDDTPIWPVVQHALGGVESAEHREYEHVVLLDPTSPARDLADVALALDRLRSAPDADGIVAVSQPPFNPMWTCVIEENGWMTDLAKEGALFTRRQDVPTVYRINALLYIWRSRFVRSAPSWRVGARNLLYETPDARAIHIDTLEDFSHAEWLVASGTVRLPWLEHSSL